MTKADEMALLDTFIAKLGTDSYLGPYLASNREAILRDLTSDIVPRLLLPKEGHDEAVRLIALAEAASIKMRAEADRYAADVMSRAREEARQVRMTARHTLEQLAAKL